MTAYVQGGALETSRLEWLGVAEGVTADQLIAPAEVERAEDRSELGEATDFLRERLERGDRHLSREVQKEAREAGIKTKTFHRARRALGVVAKRYLDPATEKMAWYVWLPGVGGQGGRASAPWPPTANGEQKPQAPQADAVNELDGQGLDGQAARESSEEPDLAFPEH